MATKIKTMQVTVYGAPAATPQGVEYQVERVTDTVEYRPGQYLTKAQVDTLCHAKDWKITLTKPKG